MQPNPEFKGSIRKLILKKEKFKYNLVLPNIKKKKTNVFFVSNNRGYGSYRCNIPSEIYKTFLSKCKQVEWSVEDDKVVVRPV